MKQRMPLNPAYDLTRLITQMDEGNPGAMSVLLKTLEHKPDNFIGLILDLDDMNIRGSQIWVAYKDFANKDLPRFIEAVKERNPQMVEAVNKGCSDIAVAVVSGASFERVA